MKDRSVVTRIDKNIITDVHVLISSEFKITPLVKYLMYSKIYMKRESKPKRYIRNVRRLALF